MPVDVFGFIMTRSKPRTCECVTLQWILISREPSLPPYRETRATIRVELCIRRVLVCRCVPCVSTSLFHSYAHSTHTPTPTYIYTHTHTHTHTLPFLFANSVFIGK